MGVLLVQWFNFDWHIPCNAQRFVGNSICIKSRKYFSLDFFLFLIIAIIAINSKQTHLCKDSELEQTANKMDKTYSDLILDIKIFNSLRIKCYKIKQFSFSSICFGFDKSIEKC